MTNEELAEAVRRGEDQDGSLLMELWNSNQGYIHAILKRYDGLAEESDIQQEAFLGLMEAVKRWSSERGVPFMVYAGHWIRQACVRYVEKSQGISISMQSKIRQLHKVESNFQQDHGRSPSDAEISELMDLTQNEVLEIKRAKNGQNKLSLDAEQSVDDGDSYTLEELVPGVDDPEADVVDRYQQEQLAAVVWDEVDALDPDQADTLHKRYGDQLTAREVGELTGRTGQQIADMERKALAKMRSTPRTRKRLLPFLDDEIRSEGMKGTGPGSFARKWTSSTERVALKMYRRSE